MDQEASYKAIKTQIAEPMGLGVEDAAAGMYQVINTNMAQGVREISIKRGLDPREFPLVVAGGAGPLHACMICQELEIPLFIVPRESSIFCAAGMLMSDLQHDFVRSFVTAFDRIDWQELNSLVVEMVSEGAALLTKEKIPSSNQHFSLDLDCRYLKQFHEVSFPVSLATIRERNADAIIQTFHSEHKRLYGYSLEEEKTAIELINVRLRAVGHTEKPSYAEETYTQESAKDTLKGERNVYIPEARTFRHVSVYDGHKTRHGNRIAGPALIEQVNTTIFLSAAFDCVCDKYGSFVIHKKGHENQLGKTLREGK